MSREGSQITIKSGKITAQGGTFGAGIGGGNQCNGGTITISGGTVTATDGKGGAGIGGGEGGAGGTITISGENTKVTAQSNSNGAGIGGGNEGAGGKITISGGEVQATGGLNGAGIGGGSKDSNGNGGDGGTITISGGNVTTKSDSNGAGIGGGSYATGGKITISGGTVTAKGGNNGAGIGGGEGGAGGTITISGGTVTANGGGNGAGIGGGQNGNGGTIMITGGTVQEAKGGANAAGIGGGKDGDGGTIILSGGTVTANGGNWGAGIGGGYKDNNGGNGGTIKITGGTVKATGDEYGAGIGGGFGGAGGEITIEGGTVEEAKGGNLAAGIGGGNGGAGGTITISGSSTTIVTATGGSNAAGIGGGDGKDGGTITIKEGTVTANGGSGAAGIGGGYGQYGAAGTITIKGGTVTAKGGLAGAAGIGAGEGNSDGTITITGGEVTATNGSETATITPDIKGNTVIVGPGATVKKGIENGTLEYNDYANGFVFENGQNGATMQGTATLLADMTIDSGKELTISEGASFTIEEGVILTNKGTITIEDNGTIKNAGKITGNDPVGGNLLTKLKKEMIEIAGGPYTYDGSEVTPTVTVKSSSNTVYVEGADKDYTLAYADNINAGTAHVTVTPTQTGSLYVDEGDAVTKTFTINPKPLSFTFSGLENLTYDGQEHGATANANNLAEGDNVNPTLTYQKKGTDNTFSDITGKPTDAGSYKVTVSQISGEKASNYIISDNESDKSKEFTIAKATPSTPTGLTATYGETLADVTLPAGWAWIEPTTSVGEVGTNKFHAKYTPEDTDNYNVVENVQVSIKVVMEADLSFAQPTLTITQGDAVPANALTKPEDCTVNYTSSEPTVATVDAETGVVAVVGVGTTTITAMAQGNYTGSASYTLTVNSYIPPYIPPTPDPDPIYYTVTIPTEVAGAIIHGGGTHEVEEYTYCSFRIELDPNGNGEYPTVTKGYWWDTLTPDGQGNYSVYVTGNTQITIGEVPTNSYDYYQVTLPTDSVAEADDQYWSGDYIEVTGASPLRAAEEASLSYQAPFGTTVTLRPIETERRKFLQWEDGSKQKERTLPLRADQEVKALWQRVSPTGIEAIAAGSVIRGERGQLYIEVPEPCNVTLYTYGGVPVRVARLAAGANRLSNLNAGLYLVKLEAAPAVPVRVR